MLKTALRTTFVILSFGLMTGSLQSARASDGADALPVFQKDNVILFQGDSITDGGRQRTGSDYNHIMGQCYAYILSAQLGAQYPERNLTFINRGISGNRVSDLAKRWQQDTLDLKPDFLADTLAALPHVKIVLGEPFLLPVGMHKDVYNAELAEVKKRQEVVARLAQKYHLPMVSYQKAFDDACQKAPADHWSWDGIHPTYAGHGLMVHAWLETVNQFWPRG